MINLVCIDGASASSGPRLSDVVKQTLREQGAKVSAHYYRSSVLPIFRQIQWRRVREAVLRRSNPANILFLAGKSFGAIWALDLLKLKLEYSRIVLVTVDPHDPGQSLISYVVDCPQLVKGWNVYQFRSWPRGRRVQYVHAINVQIGDPGVDHRNIVLTPQVRDALAAALLAIDDQTDK